MSRLLRADLVAAAGSGVAQHIADKRDQIGTFRLHFLAEPLEMSARLVEVGHRQNSKAHNDSLRIPSGRRRMSSCNDPTVGDSPHARTVLFWTQSRSTSSGGRCFWSKL